MKILKSILIIASVLFLFASCDKEDGYHSSSYGHYKAMFISKADIRVHVHPSTVPQGFKVHIDPGHTWEFVETIDKHGGFGNHFTITHNQPHTYLFSGILLPKIYTIYNDSVSISDYPE